MTRDPQATPPDRDEPSAATGAPPGDLGREPSSPEPSGTETDGRRGHRWWWVAGLAIAALIVIVLAPLASTDPDGLKFLKVHREKYLKPGHTPASTWVVVSRLANPAWVVEMETVAAKAD